MPQEKLLENHTEKHEVSGEQTIESIKGFCTSALIHSVKEKQLIQNQAADLLCEWFGDESEPLLEELYKQTTIYYKDKKKK